MNLQHRYARALFALIERSPSKASLYVRNMGEVLKRRGHEKLLPKIFSEYRALTLAKDRAQMHRTISPEQERTRILVELYQKLIAS